jgi:uncharacterized protein HemY
MLRLHRFLVPLFPRTQTLRKYNANVEVGHTLTYLGNLYCVRGQWTEAEEAYQQSLEMRRKMKDRVYEGETLKQLAKLKAAQGNIEEALDYAQQAKAVLETTEDKNWLAEVRELITKLALP